MANHEFKLHRLIFDADISIANANGSHSSNSSSAGTGENVDSNMVIILAALLCALVCALGLNSIVRCALRCSGGRFSFQDLEGTTTSARQLITTATTSSSTTAGIRKDKLCQIPVVVYGSGGKIPATDCPICIGEFMEGEKVRILPVCNHGFHAKCVDIWLLSRSSCPTCRQQLLFEQKNQQQQQQPNSSNSAEMSSVPFHY